MRHTRAACGAVLALIAMTHVAHAQPPAPRICVLASDADPLLAERVVAELDTMHFDAELVTAAPPREPASALASIARTHAAAAAVHIERAGSGYRLWLVDRATGKTLMRELAATDAAELDQLALRVVELLRASLLETRLPEAPAGEVPASSELLRAAQLPEPSAAPRTPSEPLAAPALALELGPSVVVSPYGLPALAALSAAVGFTLAPSLRMGAFAAIPLHSLPHRAREGSSATRVTLVGLDARIEPMLAVLRPALGAGWVVAVVSTTGRAAGPLYKAASHSAANMGPYLRPSLALELRPGLLLRLEGTAGVLLHAFSITYGYREVASWGPLFVAGSLTLEARL